MEREAYRASRQLLRRIQDHLYTMHQQKGGHHETIGLVEVCWLDAEHPQYNYVTPRRNTAWVSGPMIEAGLQHLVQAGYTARVHYLDGLYPPALAKTLQNLGLEHTENIMLRVWDTNPTPPTLPASYRWEIHTGLIPVALWTRMNIYAEPAMAQVAEEAQQYIILYQHERPIGAVCLGAGDSVVHIRALGLLPEADTAAVQDALLTSTIQARPQDTLLVHVIEKYPSAIPFTDLGHIVCYTAPPAEEEGKA